MKRTHLAAFGTFVTAGLAGLLLAVSGNHETSTQEPTSTDLARTDSARNSMSQSDTFSEDRGGFIKPTALPHDLQSPELGQYYSDEDVLSELDDILARFKQGDDTLTDEELAAFEAKLARTVEHSESGRALLKERFLEAIDNDDFLTVFRLERAFSSSTEGIDDLVDVYDYAVKAGKPPLDSYVLQGLSSMNNFLSESERNLYAADTVSQLTEYSDFAHRGPGLKYLRTALQHGMYDGIDPEILELANQQVTNIHQQAESDSPEQYSSARTLLSMAPPEESLRLARNFLNADPSESHVTAVMWAIDNGSVLPDNDLIFSLQQAMALGDVSPNLAQLAANWFPSWDWPGS